MKHLVTVVSLALGTGMALPAMADPDTVAARQGQFKLFAHNLGILGPMAQGRVDYDAGAAQKAADNLYHLTRTDQGTLWPEGTGSDSMEGTRASPAIWDNLDDFVDKYAALQVAAEGLQDVAGDGLDALRPALGALGAACGACHEAYREDAR